MVCMSEIDVLLKEVADIKTTVDNKVAAGQKPIQEEIARMGKVLTEAQAEVKKLQVKDGSRIMHDSDITVRDGQFAGFNANDLSAAAAGLANKALNMSGQPPVTALKSYERLVQARQSLHDAIGPDFISSWEEKAVRAMTGSGVYTEQARQRAKQGAAAYAWDMRRVWAKTKALDSTTAAAGDELVPTLENASLWLDVNLNTTILPLFRQVPMPSNPYDWPVQFGDTNWYPVTENVQVTTTTPSTGKVSLTAYGLKTGIPFSDELDEDSIVALVPELRATLVRNAAQVIDDVILNADTTLANSINADGATISAATAGKAQWTLGFNGLIRYALVTNTAASGTAAKVDINSTISAGTVYNKLLRMLGKFGAAQVLGDVVFISDVNTAIASLTMDEVELMTNFGPRATISSGELARIYGAPLVVSGQMKLADTDGKVTSAGNTTNTGRVMATNLSQWAVAFRRGITFEPDREPGKGQTTLYVSMRIALNDRNNGSAALNPSHTAIAYDITGIT